MTREEAIKKIRKLLALAGSDNPNESATALRQASALMRKYSVDDAAVAMSQVQQSSAKAARQSFPPWLGALVKVISGAFGCKAWIGSDHKRRLEVHFLGVDPKPEIAQYAFTVLRRQLTASRARYYKTTRGKRPNRIRRADDYALAFVTAVAVEVERFAGQVPDVVERAYLAIREQKRLVKRGYRIGELDNRAAASGFTDGSKVRLQTAINGEEQRRLL